MISHIYAKNILNALFKTKGGAGITAEQELASFGLSSFSFEELNTETGLYEEKTVNGLTYEDYYNAFVKDGYRERNNTKTLNDIKNKVSSSQWYTVRTLNTLHYKEYEVYRVDAEGNFVEKVNATTGKKERETYKKTFYSWMAKKNEKQNVPYPAKGFLALFTTMPDLDGNNYEEPAEGTTYIRVNLKEDIIAGQAVLNLAVNRDGVALVDNNKIIMYPEIDQNAWGTIKGFGIFETQERGSGKPIIWGPLKDADGTMTEVVTQSNYVPLFRVGQFKITLS